ncbi:uncharacterized protein C8Q71DRAFT_445660 [Rhodofomes roseus]|uniref:Uncharacterized protein n=1 Tax=Rhodofomes roseus TaxID=34475 RepID=A0ABQ8JY16_9APHY|nr:uncharacterized protein C8Q71DRAFT_445660 [Rhodofomes roseus]KAH9829151.1 hypothetical protein C8Q71DRAFT_445660 [Rhodofomes roseus]
MLLPGCCRCMTASALTCLTAPRYSKSGRGFKLQASSMDDEHERYWSLAKGNAGEYYEVACRDATRFKGLSDSHSAAARLYALPLARSPGRGSLRVSVGIRPTGDTGVLQDATLLGTCLLEHSFKQNNEKLEAISCAATPSQHLLHRSLTTI